MSEICVDCWNKVTENNYRKKKFIVSRQPELCEECGQWKPVIIRYKGRYILKDRISDLWEDLQRLRK